MIGFSIALLSLFAAHLSGWSTGKPDQPAFIAAAFGITALILQIGAAIILTGGAK